METNTPTPPAVVESASLDSLSGLSRAEERSGREQKGTLGGLDRRFDIHTGVATTQGRSNAMVARLIHSHGARHALVRTCCSERTPAVLDSYDLRVAHSDLDVGRGLASGVNGHAASQLLSVSRLTGSWT